MNYSFPVVIMGGPNKRVDKNLTLTSLLVRVNSDFIELEHRDRDGAAFDTIRITPDGQVQEISVNEEVFKLYNY